MKFKYIDFIICTNEINTNYRIFVLFRYFKCILILHKYQKYQNENRLICSTSRDEINSYFLCS